MTRGIGEFAAIQDLIPEWLAVGIALLTQLADAWFLGLLLLALYWFHADARDDVAAVAGFTLAGFGAYRGLKHVFALPRPREPLVDEGLPWFLQLVYDVTGTASGYGFPSGHATSATIVYVGLAAVLAVGSRRQRFAGAATLVALVSFSRVALGVHYLVDVVAGVALGCALLWVGFATSRRLQFDRPTVAFGMAIPLAACYVLASAAVWESVVILGASLGAFAAWQFVVLGRELVERDRPSRALRSLSIYGVLGGLALASLLALQEPFSPLESHPYPLGGVVGLLTAAVVAAPVARSSAPVQRTVRALRFWSGATLVELRRRYRRTSLQDVRDVLQKYRRELGRRLDDGRRTDG